MTQDGNTNGGCQASGRTPESSSKTGGERSDAASLPLAARVCVANEIGTVLINGIISQVHADVILEGET